MIENIFSVPIYRARFADIQCLSALTNSVAFQNLPDKTPAQEAYFGGVVNSGLFAWRHDDSTQPHQLPEFQTVCDWISQHAKAYWDQMPYYPDVTPVIHQSWVTRYGTGGSIRSHNHGIPIDLVAAFYISSTIDQGSLVLEHPLELLLSTQPYKIPRDQPKKFNHRISVETGDLVMFPAWMKHHSEPNLTNDTRIVLTIDFTGT